MTTPASPQPEPSTEPLDRRKLYAYRAAMNAMELNPATSALLIVDLQNASADPSSGWVKAYAEAGHGDVLNRYFEKVRDQVLPNVKLLQDAFREAGAPVVFLTVGSAVGDWSDMAPRFRRSIAYWQGRGIEPPYAAAGTRAMQVLDAIAPRPGEPVIVKTGYSGFTGSPLERVLRNKGIRELAVCGVATDACVESTFRAAVDLGFDCALIEDACASVTEEDHVIGVKAMRLFGRISTARELAAEILATRAVSAPVTAS